MFFAPSKSRQRAKIRIMGVSKTSDHIQIKIKMPNPSQESPVSSKAPNQDLNGIDVLCSFKIKINLRQTSAWKYLRTIQLKIVNMSFKVLVMGGVKTNLEHWFCPRAIILILRLSKLSFAGIRLIIMKYINFGIFYFKCIIFINFFLQKGRLTILIYKMLVSVCVCVSVFPCLRSPC